MRISKKEREETRKRILDRARELFLRTGYEETTTRDLARASGIATGTLFNYFPTKEALALTLIGDALLRGREDYSKRRTGEEELAEDLFLLVTSELRRLRPFRRFVGPVLESSMSLFAKEKSNAMGEKLRVRHLACVQGMIGAKGFSHLPGIILINLYWSLYLGILAYWSNDTSRNQAETLVLIDYAFKIFTRAIAGASHA